MAASSLRSAKGKMLAAGMAGFIVGLLFGDLFMQATDVVVHMAAFSHPEVVHGGQGNIIGFATDGASANSAIHSLQPGRKDLKHGKDQDQTVKASHVEMKSSLVSGFAEGPHEGNTIHTLVTSNGSPYQNIQTRIMYATYKLAQQMDGGERMVAFTRILHRTVEDLLMNEVPTVRVNPRDPACDLWCDFPVADRPGAVRQFLLAAKTDPALIKAPWLLLIETDYVWAKPIKPPPAAESSNLSWGFPFGYISPTHPPLRSVIRTMYPLERGPLANIPATGPAPVLVRPAELHKVVLDWERLALHIEGDNESKEKLGWVREMYAFSIACALNDVHLDLRPVPSNPLIVQPPADSTLGEAAMYHYTWGSAFLDGAGNKVYEFDKRQYTAADLQFKVPILATPPPFQEGWKLHDSSPVSQEKYGLVKDMIDRMNEGIRALPVLPIDAQSKLQ